MICVLTADASLKSTKNWRGTEFGAHFNLLLSHNLPLNRSRSCDMVKRVVSLKLLETLHERLAIITSTRHLDKEFTLVRGHHLAAAVYPLMSSEEIREPAANRVDDALSKPESLFPKAEDCFDISSDGHYVPIICGDRSLLGILGGFLEGPHDEVVRNTPVCNLESNREERLAGWQHTRLPMSSRRDFK
jgi:hypothetical protein